MTTLATPARPAAPDGAAGTPARRLARAVAACTRVHSAGTSPGRRPRTCVDGGRRARSRPACPRRRRSATSIQARRASTRVEQHVEIAGWAVTGPRRRGQREADPEQRKRLALAGDRRLGPVPLSTGQTADDDPDDEQEEQVEPLLRVLDRERVARLDEQEVVQEEGADRRQRPPAPPRPRPRSPPRPAGRPRRRRRSRPTRGRDDRRVTITSLTSTMAAARSPRGVRPATTTMSSTRRQYRAAPGDSG